MDTTQTVRERSRNMSRSLQGHDPFFEFVQDRASADAQDACGSADAAAIERHGENLRCDFGQAPFVTDGVSLLLTNSMHWLPCHSHGKAVNLLGAGQRSRACCIGNQASVQA